MCSLGVAFQKPGQLEVAREQYQSALRIDSENASAHNNLAALYLAQGRWSEAASHLERAIRINPHYAKAYHNLGVAYTKQSKWTEAIDSFQRAAEVDPDFAKRTGTWAIRTRRKDRSIWRCSTTDGRCGLIPRS